MNDITMNLNADHLIRQALQEDITSEDITTNAVMRERNRERCSLSVNRTELLQDWLFLNGFSSY